MGKRRSSFEAVQKSVVRVKDNNGQTWGTGFFISREGHLLTCAHVVQDAGGWKNVRILDQPVNCLYEGDPERDDFCLLQAEDIQSISIEFGQDFDPEDEFLSFGFSNDDFYGAPIHGKITAFARCGKLGDQQLIRLETFSDAQRIEGGQSGAPVLLYKRGRYRTIGLLVASEDLNGGLALPISSVLKKINLHNSPLSNLSEVYKNRWLLVTLVTFLSTLLLSAPLLYKSLETFNQCSDDKVTSNISSVENNLDKGNTEAALSQIDRFSQKCKNDRLLITKSQILLKKNDLEQAAGILQALLSKKSLSSDTITQARYQLGIVLAKSNDYSKAIEQFKQVEDDLVLKPKVYYNLGLCYYKLERWDEATQKLIYVAETLRDRATNEQAEDELTRYYPFALYYLIDIDAKRWYESRNSNKADTFKKSFLKRYYERHLYNVRKNIAQRKVSLERLVSTIRNKSETSPEYSYIYQTKEFKNSICTMYQDVQKEVPQNIKTFCK